jgi:membrane protein implicated in regulation of membrane protease activity
LLTGTFYLLMLAVGAGAAALQPIWALPPCRSSRRPGRRRLGGGWHLAAQARPGDPSARADRSVNLDVGETVMIDSWNADGTAIVKYRGAQWTAIHRPACTPSTGMHRVAELVGSRLLVDPL